MPPTQAPGDLIAARIAVLPNGDVAQVVLSERTGPYAVTLREAYARWYGGGAWSPWRLIAGDAHDISIAADIGQQEATALVGVLVWVPAPTGVIAANHVSHRPAFYRLTASGVVPADDL
jgi:hypothetical protein